MAGKLKGILRQEKWFWHLWPVVVLWAICFPSWPLSRMYPQDWENQLWWMSYQGCHIAETGVPADVYNYKETVCLGTALFYGALIYPYGGLLTLLVGGNVALRIMIVGIFLIQYTSMVRLGRSYGWPQPLRHLLATLMLWAVYPLINLYWRGACAELWAWAFLVTSICSLIQVLRNPSGPETRYDRMAWGFFFVLAASTHVLTGLTGAVVVALICVTGWLGLDWQGRKQLIMQVILSGVAGAMVQLSWLYLMVKFGSSLTVANSDNSVRAFLEITRIESGVVDWTTLLSPLSFSAQSMNLPLKDETSLEIVLGDRVSLALVIFLIGTVRAMFRAKSLRAWKFTDQSLLVLGLVMAEASFSIVGCPDFAKHFASVLGFLQFPYRLTNYVNMGLFLAIIGCLARPIRWRVERQLWLRIFGMMALAVAALSVWSKLGGVSAMILPQTAERWTSAFSSYPTGTVPSYYGRSDYAITRWNQEQPITPETPYMELVTPLDNMDVATATITLPAAAWVRNQAELFPWDQFRLDGKLLPLEEVRFCHVPDQPRQLGCAINIPAGTHRLEFRFVPPLWWEIAREASFVLAGLWGLLVLGTGIFGVWERFGYNKT